MSDLVERLRKPSDSEETMSAWDGLRAYLLKGGRGSYARDVFEAILSKIDEEREEAAARIESLEREAEELRAALDNPNDIWGEVRRTSDGELAIFSPVYNIVKARFTRGSITGWSVGDRVYRRTPPRKPTEAEGRE